MEQEYFTLNLKKFLVSFVASPTFSKGMENVEGLEGDTLQFNVEINGNPKPTIKW